ncbi:hypothetical protein C8R48DRAFT_832563, partial [Suillus tomentosus]
MSRLSSVGATPIATVNITPVTTMCSCYKPKYHHTRTPYNMSSLTFPSRMIASGKISFAADSAVKNAEDTILNLKLFKECIEKVKLDDGQAIYIFQTSAVDSVIVKKIAIGPFEMVISSDTDALTATPWVLSSSTATLKLTSMSRPEAWCRVSQVSSWIQTTMSSCSGTSLLLEWRQRVPMVSSTS